MAIVLVLCVLVYIISGLLAASNAIITSVMFRPDEDRESCEEIIKRNNKTILILMVLGAVFGLASTTALGFSLKSGLAIFICAFILGIIIRAFMPKK